MIDPKLPVSQGVKTSDLVKRQTALLSLGKSDFEAIEECRSSRFFRKALGISKVSSAVRRRQRMDALAPKLLNLADERSLRWLARSQAPITPHDGYVGLDIDTFVMDNSDSLKEAVGRTCQGDTPLAAYLGNEAWCIGLQLRPGVQHSVLEFGYFL